MPALMISSLAHTVLVSSRRRSVGDTPKPVGLNLKRMKLKMKIRNGKEYRKRVKSC